MLSCFSLQPFLTSLGYLLIQCSNEHHFQISHKGHRSISSESSCYSLSFANSLIQCRQRQCLENNHKGLQTCAVRVIPLQMSNDSAGYAHAGRFHVHVCINTVKSSAFHTEKRLVRKPVTRALSIGCGVHSPSAPEPTSGPNPGNGTALCFS